MFWKQNKNNSSESPRILTLDYPLMPSLMEFRSLGENRLLSALPIEYQERLRTSTRPVTLSSGEVIHEPGGRLDQVCFPLTAIIAFVHTTEEGSTAVMGLAGNEGLVGIDFFLSNDAFFSGAVVLVAGNALQVKAEALEEEFAKGDLFQRLLLRYTQALIIQLSQTAICNRLHLLGKRICRWLLFCHDRVRSDDLRMTHEAISSVVSVRRESATVALRRLQQLGLIQQAQGYITILDRKGLEARACECYRVVETETDRLLGTQGKRAPEVSGRHAR